MVGITVVVIVDTLVAAAAAAVVVGLTFAIAVNENAVDIVAIVAQVAVASVGAHYCC